MMNLLGVSENVLGENNFLSIVVSEDMPLISKRDLGDKSKNPLPPENFQRRSLV